jgi:hypothetical protein
MLDLSQNSTVSTLVITSVSFGVMKHAKYLNISKVIVLPERII